MFPDRLEMPLTAKQSLLHCLNKGKEDKALYIGVTQSQRIDIFLSCPGILARG